MKQSKGDEMLHLETNDIRAELMTMHRGLSVINGIPVDRRSVNKWTIGSWCVKCTGLAKAARVLEAWLEPPRGMKDSSGSVKKNMSG